MFDTRRFGGYLARLRKKADMTQSELAEKLNISRQAISQYELGDSFPDVSVLVLIADIFGVTLDALIGAGEPTRGEYKVLDKLARGNRDVTAGSLEDVVSLAPLLKPSILEKLSEDLARQGIDISSVIILAEYLNDESVRRLIETASFDCISHELLEKFLPMLDEQAKEAIFQKVLEGELNYRFIRALLPYAKHMLSPIEAAVMDGALPKEALDIVREYVFTNL